MALSLQPSEQLKPQLGNGSEDTKSLVKADLKMLAGVPKIVLPLFQIEKRKLIKELRDKTHFGASRLKAEFNLPHSARTINKVFRRYNLIRKRKRKYHKKNDLRQEKAK